MFGLKRGTVILAPHEAQWEQQARQIIELLWQVLGAAAEDIQHVGSTSVKSICAKPIVDIAVGMRDPDRVADFERTLADRGVVFRGRERDEDGGWLFVMGDFARDTRTCHIHVVAYEGKAWHNYIAFRDYLNHCEQAAREYERLKIALAAQFPNDRESYTRGKGELIARLLERAAARQNGKEETTCV